jgi:PAS domain S-box-containing protein
MKTPRNLPNQDEELALDQPKQATVVRESMQAFSECFADVVCVATVDERGVPDLETVNEGFTRISGYTLEELRRRGGVPFALHPDDVLTALQSLERVLSGQQDQGEIRMIRKDGSLRWIRYLAQPEWDSEQGRVVRIRACAQDVSERKSALEVIEESERRFRQLADNIHEVFWLTDPLKTQVLYVSPAYEQIWGRSCQSLYENPLSFLESIHPDDRAAVAASFEKHSKGESTRGEYRLLRPDGSIRWILDRGSPIRNETGEVYRVAGIAEDITERKKVEEALAATDRRKDEFLATLAHELRNPLAPIRNAVEVMRLRNVDDPALVRCRDVIERQVKQLTRLVDDLLDISRISRGRVELRKEVIDLATVVRRALETTRPLIEERRHQLTVSLPPEPVWLEADATRLEQVLVNLLNNAAKYTDRGGEVSLTASGEGSEVVVRVRDSGIGIPDDLLDHVFDIFVQGDHTKDQAKGGLGIGLSLVRNLVDMHGGCITARSAGRGAGSEFVLRLPARSAAAGVPDRSPAGNSRKPQPSGANG